MQNIIAKVAVSSATFWLDKPYDYKIPEPLRGAVVPGVRVIVPFSRGNRRSEGIVLAVSGDSAYDNLKSIDSLLDEEPVLSRELLRLALWMRDRFFCTVFDAVRAMLPAGLWYRTKNSYSVTEGYDRESAYLSAGTAPLYREILDFIFAAGGRAEQAALIAAFEEKNIGPALKKLVSKGILASDSREVRRIGDKTVDIASLEVSAEDAAALAAQKKKKAPMQSAVLELLSAIGAVPVKEIRYFTGAGGATIKALQKAGVIGIEYQEVYRRPQYGAPRPAEPIVLNEEQTKAFEGIRKLLDKDEAEAALLYGVTGSGKTSIYIKLIEEVLKKGRSAIVLVPEIALTPQLMDTFTSYFGDSTAVLHSSLGMGERYDEWKRIRAGEASVVIGTRSAVFAPVNDLDLIIVDEEQEYTYKSENNPRYHALDIAKYRCAKNGALLLLGSATPSIESAYNAREGKYHLFRLSARYNQKDLPRVNIADMKKELRSGNGGTISGVLRAELEKNINSGQQSILFINRRGASGLVACGECGHTFRCSRCSVSLTYHSANRRLMCHYCGYSEPLPRECGECGGILKFVGAGTQKVEEEVKELFPGVGVIRMDTDTVSPSKSHEALLTRFREKRIPILVGTQMVTKGLNFENVTLVGVILADQSLYINDYRANERTFSLITQVVGRSGRGDKAGRAVIQTFTPENEVIRLAAAQDYDGFYEREIGFRNVLGAPPVADLYSITASGLDEPAVLGACAVIRRMLAAYLRDMENVKILGPAPAVIARVNNRFRYRVTVSAPAGGDIRDVISHVVREFSSNRKNRGVSVYADVNAFE